MADTLAGRRVDILAARGVEEVDLVEQRTSSEVVRSPRGPPWPPTSTTPGAPDH